MKSMNNSKHFSNEYFVEWFANGLKEYLDNQNPKAYNSHIVDLAYATAAYSEAITAFIANQP